MKVGVDAVLLGAWTDLSDAAVVLDVGSGCGVITLMLAQRYENLNLTGIDVDAAAVDESVENAGNTPWNDSVKFQIADFMDFCIGENPPVDHIVSNPPYFNSGVDSNSSLRMTARHTGTLSPVSLIEYGAKILSPKGKISMICPCEWLDDIKKTADENSLHLSRLTKVRGNEEVEFKRILVELSKQPKEYSETELTLEISRGVPTEAYRLLTKDFYLKF